jgi:hypothetical protein
MSAFNTLHFRGRCPRCSCEQDFEAEVRVGVTDGLQLRVGDAIEWMLGDLHGGNVIDENGSAECAHCRASLRVVTDVRDSRIIAACIRGLIDWRLE